MNDDEVRLAFYDLGNKMIQLMYILNLLVQAVNIPLMIATRVKLKLSAVQNYISCTTLSHQKHLAPKKISNEIVKKRMYIHWMYDI